MSTTVSFAPPRVRHSPWIRIQPDPSTETETEPLCEEISLRPEWAIARKILVMRLDNIGDVIMSGPALRAIKENLALAHLTLMASPAGSQAAPLLPWVDEVLTWRTLWQELNPWPLNPEREWELIEELRRRSFDAAIILTSFSQTPHPAALACHLAGIPLRLGQSKEHGRGVLTAELAAPPDELHQVERNLHLLETVGFQVRERRLEVFLSDQVRRQAHRLLTDHGLVAGSPYLLLQPWASCQSRTYFPERMATAARQVAEKTGWPVVIVGREDDRERSRPLLDILGLRGIDVVGVSSVPQLAALIAGARLVFTNNTVAMHLAEATGVPQLLVFAGTELESQWAPRYSPVRILRRPTPCSPCYAFTCPTLQECMDFTPEEAAIEALQLLEEVPAVQERDTSQNVSALVS